MIDDFTYPTAESRLITFQIGAVCVNWSQIDNFLGLILGQYMKLPHGHVDLATGIVDLSKKCELNKCMSFLYDDRDTYKRFERAMTFIDSDIRPVRNRYVHDSYSFFTGENVRKIYKAKVINVKSFTKDLMTRVEKEVTASELVEFNKDLDICSMYLASHFVQKIADKTGATKEFIDAATKVGGEAYDELSIVVDRYRSKGGSKARDSKAAK